MSVPCIISASLHLSAKNYKNWWKFDEVLTKTILHSFFRHGVYVSIFTGFLRELTDFFVNSVTFIAVCQSVMFVFVVCYCLSLWHLSICRAVEIKGVD